MPIRKIARTVNAAFKDADHARKAYGSAEFRKGVKQDRPGTLGEFRTVKHALKDREAIQKKRGNAKGKS